MSYTRLFAMDFGTGENGRTMNAQLYNSDGTTNGSAITSGIVDLGNGVYLYSHTSVPDNHRGAFLMYDSSDTTAYVIEEINPESSEYADQKISALNDLSAAEVNAEVDQALLDYDGPTAAELTATQTAITTAIAALNDLSAAEVNAEVDTALADYDGPTKAELDAAQAAITTAIAALNDLSAAEVNAEVDQALLDYDGPTAAELTATQTAITTAISALNDLSAAEVNAEVDTALADYDGPTKAELDTAQTAITTAISALNDLSAAEVNAEVDTALADYDGPTKAELDTAQTAITTAISALNDLSAADIWTYTTRTLTTSSASGSSSGSGSTLTVTQAVTFSAQTSGLALPATWSKLYFTVKRNLHLADNNAVIRVVVSNPADGADGLLVLNGAAATASQGSLVVDQPGGSVTITLADEATAQLGEEYDLDYDLKVLLSDGTSQVLTRSTLDVTLTPTLAVS